MTTSAELRVGFPPAAADSPKRQDAAELARRLGERLAMPLAVQHATDYRGLVEDLVGGRLDAAWLPPLLLLRTERQVRPVLALERAGSFSYHGAIVARRDAGIVGISDLAGKRVGWVDADSAAGCVLSRALIAELHPDVDAFLGPQRMLGSHRAVVEAVLAREVDAGGTFLNVGPTGAIVLSAWEQFFGERASEIAPVAITGAIPSDVLGVGWHVPAEQVRALVEALHAFAAEPDGRDVIAAAFNGATGFSKPRPDAYDRLADLARRAGWRP